jgi:glucose-6-phosphate 1-dehydrogenase
LIEDFSDEKFMATQDHPEPAIFIIFGGGGDLTWRKLVPALFSLYLGKSLPEQVAIIGVDRANLTDSALRQRLHDGVKRFCRKQGSKSADWVTFAARIQYCQGDFKSPKPERCSRPSILM